MGPSDALGVLGVNALGVLGVNALGGIDNCELDADIWDLGVGGIDNCELDADICTGLLFSFTFS